VALTIDAVVEDVIAQAWRACGEGLDRAALRHQLRAFYLAGDAARFWRAVGLAFDDASRLLGMGADAAVVRDCVREIVSKVAEWG
jgi:hypothetical protein